MYYYVLLILNTDLQKLKQWYKQAFLIQIYGLNN